MGPLTLWIFFFALVAQAYSQALHEYCPWETFKASCKSDEVIIMETARYGRMHLGRCVKNDLGYVGCFTDVLDLLDSRCSGKNQCEFQTPDRELSKLQPCLEDLTSYLEASYRCVKGELLIQCENICSINRPKCSLLVNTILTHSRLTTPESSPSQGRTMPQGILFRSFVRFSRGP